MDPLYKYSLCRLCLCDGQCLVDIFKEHCVQGYNIKDDIEDLLQFKVCKVIGIPWCVCACCLHKLTDFKRFKRQCIDSKVVLENRFHQRDCMLVESELVQQCDNSGNETRQMNYSIVKREESEIVEIPESADSLTHDLCSDNVPTTDVKHEEGESHISFPEHVSWTSSASDEEETSLPADENDTCTTIGHESAGTLVVARARGRGHGSGIIPGRCTIFQESTNGKKMNRKRFSEHTSSHVDIVENRLPKMKKLGGGLLQNSTNEMGEEDYIGHVVALGIESHRAGQSKFKKSVSYSSLRESTACEVTPLVTGVEKKEGGSCSAHGGIQEGSPESSLSTSGNTSKSSFFTLGDHYVSLEDFQKGNRQDACIKALTDIGFASESPERLYSQDICTELCVIEENIVKHPEKFDVEDGSSSESERAAGLSEGGLEGASCGDSVAGQSRQDSEPMDAENKKGNRRDGVQEKNENGDKGMMYICFLCDEKFHHESQLRDHQETHLSEFLFECEVCGKTFKKRSKLMTHERTHTASEKTFECPLCGKKFSHSNLLRQHQIVHRKDKPFECKSCSKRFASRSGLRYHNKVICTTMQAS